MEKNNLFMYATGELSQDAFICWIMNFAHKNHYHEDSILRECAQALLAKIVQTDEELIITKVSKQYKNIDVLLEINDKYNIIIEDKTFTDQHGNQINKYKESLEKEGRKNIICVYWKIIEQPFTEPGVINISRLDLIGLFSQYAYKTSNCIFNDYYEYLMSLDREVKRYKTEPIENWVRVNDHAYKGFFTHLIKDNVIETNREYGWKYVANPSGGLRALWWYNLSGEELAACNLDKTYLDGLYLQIEDDIIAVKMTGNTESTPHVRWSIYNHIKGKIPEFNKKNFRSGRWMTVGYIKYDEGNYRDKIDLMQEVMKSFVNGNYSYVPNI